MGMAASGEGVDAAALRVCVDARPLGTGHARRGIGTYVAGLLAHLPPEAAAAQDIRLSCLWPAGAALPEGIGGAAHRVATSAEARCAVYHATTLEGLEPSPRYATVATLYDLIPLRMPRWERRLRDPLAHLSYLRRLRALARAEAIIAISEATKRDGVALLGLPPERIAIVPLAVDPARAYVPSAHQMAVAQEALGLEAPYFL